jgi:hypothetical protein
MGDKNKTYVIARPSEQAVAISYNDEIVTSDEALLAMTFFLPTPTCVYNSLYVEDQILLSYRSSLW